MSAVDLAPEPETVAEPTVEGEPQEAPSVFSVINRHIVGRVDVSPPFPDGSRVVVLQSANGATLVEANLSLPICEFLSQKLVEVEVIAEGDEDAAPAD